MFRVTESRLNFLEIRIKTSTSVIFLFPSLAFFSPSHRIILLVFYLPAFPPPPFSSDFFSRMRPFNCGKVLSCIAKTPPLISRSTLPSRRLFPLVAHSGLRSYSPLAVAATVQRAFRTSPRVTPAPSAAALSRQFKRYCSYRNMCRARQGGDDDGLGGGGMGVASGREILPTNVKPLHYDLTLEPDLEKFTYRGTVLIEYVF